MQSVLLDYLKECYQAMAQQFGLYRLLDRYQAILLEQQPKDWKNDYNTINKIKRYITNGADSTEGFAMGLSIKADDCILQSAPAQLFKQEGND